MDAAIGGSMNEQTVLDYKAYPVLFVDDEQNIIDTFELSFDDVFTVIGTTSAREALKVIRERDIAILVTDQRMPEMSGIDLIGAARAARPEVVPIMVTGYTDFDALVSAVNLRTVYRYVPKPWDRDDLRSTLESAIETVHIGRENRRLTAENARLVQLLSHENRHLKRREGLGDAFSALVGEGRSLHHAVALAKKVSATKATVLLLGERGTGKELFARAIHDDNAKPDAPFVTVDCTMLKAETLQSELFGHKRGAFTGAVDDRAGAFEVAHGGTVFLDEIGEMGPSEQAMLLRVLQTSSFSRMGESKPRTVDVRVIAATNRDLDGEVQANRFRDDLRDRLTIFSINVPPLRERREDIPELTRFFLAKYTRETGRGVASVVPSAIAMLLSYEYPGNIRELENMIYRAVLLCDPDETALTEAHLFGIDLAPSEDDASLPAQVRRFEREVIGQALKQHDGNRTHAAAALGISVRWLHKKMNQLEMRADTGVPAS
jgi:DNA-binding NtrC family response regulator